MTRVQIEGIIEKNTLFDPRITESEKALQLDNMVEGAMIILQHLEKVKE